MELESKAIRKDGRRLSRCPNFRRQMSFPAAEDIEQADANPNRPVGVKIVMTKQELRQLIVAIGREKSNGGHQKQTMDLLLQVLRRRHTKIAETVKDHRRRWRPALHSIPEEICE